MSTTTRASLFTALALAALTSSIVVAAAFLARGQDARVARLVAVPATLGESVVLGALSAAGIVDAIGASTALVPLSDFSAVVSVPYGNAASRSAGGDPRATPLLDELGRRFTVPGPDGTVWSVVYVPSPSPARDAGIAGAMASLGVAWAWDATPAGHESPFSWIPAVAWMVWLAMRKPKAGRLSRAMMLASWLPLLLAGSHPAALLVIVLAAATHAGEPVWRERTAARRPSRLASALWPYAVAAVAVMLFEPGLLWLLAASTALLWGMAALAPRAETLARRRWLHEPPRFRTLSVSRRQSGSPMVRYAAAVPVVAILAMAVVFPASLPKVFSGAAAARAGGAARSAMVIELGDRRSMAEASAMMEEHLAYQYALTYGRLGEASWGSSAFSELYRYREESGRLSAVTPDGSGSRGFKELQSRLDGTFDEAVLVLSGRLPVGITGPGTGR